VRSYKKLFADALWGFVSFAVPFLRDVATCSLIFLGILYFGWFLGLGRASGLKHERLEALEVLHFWLNYGVFASTGISFLWRVLLRVFRNE
jgi:hypothetical protein